MFYSTVQPISCQTLMRDFVLLFKSGCEVLISKLLKYIETSGQICLTMDTWLACNCWSFTTVTAHQIDSNWNYNLQTLDVLQLTDLIYSREYLAKKLFEITESLRITAAIFTITQDNATPNNTMLDEFEAMTEEIRDLKLNWV